MKQQTAYSILFILLFMTVSPSGFTKESLILNPHPTKSTTYTSQVKSIDGTTSASKLRAKKSHSVSEQDETKLTVFLGVLTLAMIVFLVRVMGDNK